VEIKEVKVHVASTNTSTSRIVVPYAVEPHNDEEEERINEPEINNEHIVEQPQEIVLRRSQRERNSIKKISKRKE